MDITAILAALLLMFALIVPIDLLNNIRETRLQIIEEQYDIDTVATELKTLDISDLLNQDNWDIHNELEPEANTVGILSEINFALERLDEAVRLNDNYKFMLSNSMVNGDAGFVTSKGDTRIVNKVSSVIITDNISDYTKINTFLVRTGLIPIESGDYLEISAVKIDGILPKIILPTLKGNNGKYYTIWVSDLYFTVYEKEAGDDLNPLIPSNTYRKVF